MKRFRSALLMLIVICIALSMLVACRPSEEEDLPSGLNQQGNNNQQGTLTPNSENTPSDPNQPTGPSEGPVQNNEQTGPNEGPTDTNPSNDGSNNPQNGNNDTPADLQGNPLMNASKTYNNNASVSFDLDKTGFTKTGKLADLNGKSFTLYTGVDYGMFSYINKSGKNINEWEWFKEVKRLYGATVKYVRCSSGSNAVLKPFQAMSAGKDCDLITTHVGSFPYICNILAPLDTYCNMDKLSASPGLDSMLTQQTTWKGKPIVLGPRLSNGVLNYNKTFVKEQGLDDPYTLFKKGNWNWTTFKKYMTSLPDTNNKGKAVYGCSTWSQFWYWANTNNKPCFAIDTQNPNGGVVNNWDSAEVKETFVWLESVCDAGGNYFDGNCGSSFSGVDAAKQTIMCYGTAGVDIVSIVEENKKNEYFWVPFPKNEKNPAAINHVEVYGYGIGIPRKTNKEQNRAAAVKFCELWCNRFTESRFDFLLHRAKWSYDQVIEFYEFGMTNGRFGVGSGVGKLASIANNTSTNFNRSVYDKSSTVSSCMAKLSNFAKQEIENVLKFGIQ